MLRHSMPRPASLSSLSGLPVSERAAPQTFDMLQVYHGNHWGLIAI